HRHPRGEGPDGAGAMRTTLAVLARLFVFLMLACMACAASAARKDTGTDQIVVRLKPDSEFRGKGRGPQLAQALNALAGENARYRRTTAEGHKVIRLKGRRPVQAVEAVARAMARHPDVLDAF